MTHGQFFVGSVWAKKRGCFWLAEVILPKAFEFVSNVGPSS